MQCFNPLSIGDGTGSRTTVACGRCLGCRINRSRDWSMRLTQELRDHDQAVFVTLTYGDLFCPESVSKRHIQLFLKRLRKSILPRRVRYFLSSEYGPRTHRPHYHGVLFGLGYDDRELIESAWSQGFVTVSEVTSERIEYVAKYLQKDVYSDDPNFYDTHDPEFALMSRQPPLGLSYLNIPGQIDFLKSQNYVVIKGMPYPIPRFYSKRVFVSEVEKQDRIWLQEERQKNVLTKRTLDGSSVYDWLAKAHLRVQAAERKIKARRALKRRKL